MNRKEKERRSKETEKFVKPLVSSIFIPRVCSWSRVGNYNPVKDCRTRTVSVEATTSDLELKISQTTLHARG